MWNYILQNRHWKLYQIAHTWMYCLKTIVYKWNTNIKNKSVSLCQLNVFMYTYTAPSKQLLKTLHKHSDVSKSPVGNFMGKHKHVYYISCITALDNIWDYCFIVMPQNMSHRCNSMLQSEYYQCRWWPTHHRWLQYPKPDWTTESLEWHMNIFNDTLAPYDRDIHQFTETSWLINGTQ